MPAGDTQDVIRQGGQVVAVIVPIEEYQQLRQAMQEQQVNDEFDAARAGRYRVFYTVDDERQSSKSSTWPASRSRAAQPRPKTPGATPARNHGLTAR